MTCTGIRAGAVVVAMLAATGTAHAAETLEDEVRTLTNKERTANGCPTLAGNPKLTKSAQAHTDEMAKAGNFSHTGLNGSNPAERIEKAGYVWKAAAENIAFGQKTPTEVVAAWMKSPVHRANILNCSLKELGVGYALDAKKKAYWTQNFGTA
ncbi:hypothetical protein GCM10022243_22000 [Saccharothrix violaceirubra]|uniref:Uncharacterized protein YkwD n=1 Tax=Saccharothrix violaceirubra TaxID=413306 RepID=A0A7W7T1J5_9PSEU|nr:CAP domain-containing protein [Saccharothrix violaceirubra]MBB4964867.1 uncharacterized protein YkwD [Saccharothrix violaceirubra]